MIIKTIKVRDIPPMNIPINAKEKARLVRETTENFLRSSSKSIELIDDEGLWANSNNFRRSFQSYLDNHYIESAFVTIRGNRVFLIKRNLR